MITREEFIPSFAMEYMHRHQEASWRYAKRQARARWTLMEKKATRDKDYHDYAQSRYKLEKVLE